MSYPPPPPPPHHGHPPPPYYPPPHGWAPSQHHTYPQTNHPMPYYVPGTIMVPVPMVRPPPPDASQPTYITNYIYHGETSGQPASENVQISLSGGDYSWIPSTATTASHLSGRAVIGGHEGWDGSPLWVIRAWHNGDLVPGKLSVRHNAASIMYDGKEIPVQNIEVLCARPENLRWVAASNGNIPPGAIEGGKTISGETLYVGRARHQLSLTPGKVHPTHNSCYIGFGGAEVAYKMYDVLCRIS